MPRNEPVMAGMPKMKPSVHLSFPRKEMPDGFKELSIGDDVMVMLRGKVKSLSQYEDDGSLSVEYTKLEVIGEATAKTMQDAIDATRGRKA